MATNVPPAPRLSGIAMLDVFVHHSAPSTGMQEPFGDGARLRVLGKHMLEMAYVDALMKKRPDLRGDAFSQHIELRYSDFVAHWVNAYGWKTMMRAPEGVDLDDPNEMCIIFETYAGAVAAECQADPEPGDTFGKTRALSEWIQKLVDIRD